ncbi:uncharacterized protein LOC141653670 [Silene latifolia]|uniref:uncharacterized protein LOC141653670 n=1 Tax=Silene latifolia TaxID=37657 RepID=UPI003D77EDF5
MEEARKWTVSYTKHVKQKRKLYHDGFLHLNSNSKVMLYDDCEKLLDSKYLKKDEVVKAGESMAFSSFLVDIGDPENSSSCILLPNRKSESDSRTPEKPQFPYGEKSRNTFPNKRPNTWSRKTSANNLSPSQKIIREFKKNEEVKYNTHHSPSSVATPSVKEWEALYTTQITQKAKKYHDGFIHLIICGSQARQVALYDSSKTQIDKRFLRKDEVISSGKSLKFDGHLVDIGDALGNNENDADVKKEASNCSSDQIKSDQQLHKLWNDNSVHSRRRIKAPAGQNHLGTRNAVEPVLKGQSRNEVGSSKYVDSSFGDLKVDMMKPTKPSPSRMPPRDVNHILSILKKPAAPDNLPILEKAAVKQCLSQSSEVLDIEGKTQLDPHQVATEVTNQHERDEAAKRESTETGCTGEDPQPETTEDNNIATAQAKTGCTSDDSERPQGMAFESPSKIQPSFGTAPNMLQALVDNGESVLSPVLTGRSEETRSTEHQPCAKLPETNASSKEGTSLSSKKPKARRLFSGRAVMKTSYMGTESPLGNLDCPSFDLGI